MSSVWELEPLAQWYRWGYPDAVVVRDRQGRLGCLPRSYQAALVDAFTYDVLCGNGWVSHWYMREVLVQMRRWFEVPSAAPEDRLPQFHWGILQMQGVEGAVVDVGCIQAQSLEKIGLARCLRKSFEFPPNAGISGWILRGWSPSQLTVEALHEYPIVGYWSLK